MKLSIVDSKEIVQMFNEYEEKKKVIPVNKCIGMSKEEYPYVAEMVVTKANKLVRWLWQSLLDFVSLELAAHNMTGF